MKIKEIINLLERQGDWVNRNQTRDILLVGNEEEDINKVIVCWVATKAIINKAIAMDCHFIITHENPFYLSSTALPSQLIKGQIEKKEMLDKHNIAVYRCHDLWDLYPEYGVRDRWAKILNLEFEKANTYSFIRIADKVGKTVSELADHITKVIEPFGQYGIQIIGDRNKHIKRLGIGTGACTNIFEMHNQGVDACLVSDDGINNWAHVQWAMDTEMPLLIVNHMTCEAAGMVGLKEYLETQIENVEVVFELNDYGIYCIKKDSL